MTDKVIERGFVAKASIEIKSPISKVWGALTNPEIIKQFIFGSEVVTYWIEDH